MNNQNIVPTGKRSVMSDKRLKKNIKAMAKRMREISIMVQEC